MKLVGLMWGNDPTLTLEKFTTGARPVESYISPLAPTYALVHLGWGKRLNGPVDNPASSCLSCHSTAQYPIVAPMIGSGGSIQCSDKQKMNWFRNLQGITPFGSIDPKNCEYQAPSAGDVALDYSLQMQVALKNYFDSQQNNPCKVAVEKSVFKLHARLPEIGKGSKIRKTYDLER